MIGPIIPEHSCGTAHVIDPPVIENVLVFFGNIAYLLA
jgi:hypothetical protein